MPGPVMGNPDSTDKLLLRTHRNVRAAAHPRRETLLWPAPPHYEFIDPPPRGGEPCLLTFAGGDKATGWLLGFTPEAEELKFQADKASSAVSVAFPGFLSVRLLRPVAVDRKSTRLNSS